MWWSRKADAGDSTASEEPSDAPVYNLHELILDRGLIVDLASGTKADALAEMLDALAAEGKLRAEHVPRILESLLARERLGATECTLGFAVPHPLPEVSDLMPQTLLAVGRSCEGLDWGCAEKQLVHVVLLKLGPARASDENHLRALELCTRLARHPHARDRLLKRDLKAVYLFIDEVDSVLMA